MSEGCRHGATHMGERMVVGCSPREGRKEGRKKGEGRGETASWRVQQLVGHMWREQHATAVWGKNKSAAQRKRLSPGRERKGKRRHAALLQRLSLSTVETPSHSDNRHLDNRNTRQGAQRRLLGDLTPTSVSAEVRHFTIKPPVTGGSGPSKQSRAEHTRLNYSPPQLCDHTQGQPPVTQHVHPTMGRQCE